MQIIKKTLCIAVLAAVASCHKTVATIPSAENISVSGTLQLQGFTTYQYGSYVLNAGATQYVLESTVVNADPFVGKAVVVTAVNVHYIAENGPELYNITTIRLK